MRSDRSIGQCTHGVCRDLHSAPRRRVQGRPAAAAAAADDDDDDVAVCG